MFVCSFSLFFSVKISPPSCLNRRFVILISPNMLTTPPYLVKCVTTNWYFPQKCSALLDISPCRKLSPTKYHGTLPLPFMVDNYTKRSPHKVSLCPKNSLEWQLPLGRNLWEASLHKNSLWTFSEANFALCCWSIKISPRGQSCAWRLLNGTITI